MKILMILEHEFPHDVRVENEIKALTEVGHEIHLMVYTHENRSAFEDQGSLKIYRRPISKLIHKSSVGILKFPFYFWFWKSFVNETIKKIGKVDAIHVHDLPLAKVGVEFGMKIQSPVVLDTHENWPDLLKSAKHTNTFLGKLLSSDSQWRSYERKMIKQVDRIVCVVDEMKQRLVNAGATSEHIHIYQNVPNTEELESFTNFENSKLREDFTLFYAGGITKPRGLHIVVEALSILKDKNLKPKLLICGEGIFRPELQEQVKQLGIEDQVEFTGWVNMKDVTKHLATTHAAIIPHIRSVQNDNSSPNKLFQYMLAGKAVLCSDCKSVKRIVHETKAGLSYTDTSAEDLSEKLKLLIQNPDMVKKMGERGKVAVKEKYNLNSEKESIINLYKTLE